MQITSKVATLGEGFASFQLHALFTLSDVIEAREGAIYISLDVLPRLDVEDGVALGDFTDEDPLPELADLFICTIGVLWHSGY